MKNAKIVVGGGGIGGLTAAIALRKHGFQVHVVEQAPEYRPVGAGITMQINAMAALEHIGMAKRVAARGNNLQRLVLRFSSGEVVFTTEMAPFIKEFGGQFIGIHRASLQDALLSELPTKDVTLGFRVETVSEDGDRLVVAAADGRQVEADVVVGADGVHSRIRSRLWGEEPVRYSGVTSWRGVLDDPGITPRDEAGEYWGERSVFGYVPLNDGKLYWFAAQTAPAGEFDKSDPRDALAAWFASWNCPAKAMIEETDPQVIVRTDISDRPPRFPWGKGRVTLLGDAAHPMTPNLGQGGCQAVEDGVLLAAALASANELEPALREYEKQRHPRTSKLVKDSKRFSSLAHGDSFLMRFARKRIFPHLPASLRERQMREIFRFHTPRV